MLKINTKLSNSMNKAQAWGIGDYRGSRGIPWISDETMIVGIAMSRGMFAVLYHYVVSRSISLRLLTHALVFLFTS